LYIAWQVKNLKFKKFDSDTRETGGESQNPLVKHPPIRNPASCQESRQQTVTTDYEVCVVISKQIIKLNGISIKLHTKMTSIVRIKRRQSQEPAEALVLATKRIKVEGSEQAVEENIFRFCGSTENEVFGLIFMFVCQLVILLMDCTGRKFAKYC
jgi:hypothetical protein